MRDSAPVFGDLKKNLSVLRRASIIAANAPFARLTPVCRAASLPISSPFGTRSPAAPETNIALQPVSLST